MKKAKPVLTALAVLLALLSSGQSPVFRLSGKWEQAGNWKDHIPPRQNVIEKKVTIIDGAAATLSGQAEVKRLLIGDCEDGHLIVIGPNAHFTAESLVLGRVDEVALMDIKASLVVRNGAKVTVTHRLDVGHHGSSGTFDLYSGTVETDLLRHNAYDRHPPGGSGGRTTLHGGVLTVKRLELEGGVLDIAGGTFRLKGTDQVSVIKELVAKGRIIANGSYYPILNQDYTIDVINGYTVVQAISDSSSGLG